MAQNKGNNNSNNPSNNGLEELKEKIRLQKELLATNQSQVQKALELFKVIRDMRFEYGGLDDDLKNQLKSVTEILKQNEQQVKNLEALQNKEKKLAAIRKAAAAQEKTAARNADKQANRSIHDAEELQSIQRSIGKSIGKNNKLYEAGQVFNKQMHGTLESVGRVLKSSGKNQKKLTKETEPIIQAYKDFYTGVQRSNLELAKGTVGAKEHSEAIKALSDDWESVISSMKLTGKTGEEIRAIFEAAGIPIKNAGEAAEKTKKHFEGMESAMGELGKSGIPIASELSEAVTSIGKGAAASKLAFTALGAAIGALIAKIGPGFAQMNAKLKAQNDVLEEQIELRKKLAELQNEVQFIPEKIGLERGQNLVETLNEINRATIEAGYAAERAGNSFREAFEQGGAQFRAGAKTALFGGNLGDVKMNVAQLQLAGISAEEIANSMSEASETLGKMPTAAAATQMSVFAKRSGAAVSDIADIANSMELMEGESLKTSLNLQAGIQSLASKAGVSFSNLMKGIAASSKKMLSYGILNTKQLAKQVAFAKSMGLNFDAIADAGRNMVLNYQDSIKGEMTLSSILGRQIDLSEVRQKFFEGDQRGAIEALQRQGISKEELRSPFAQEAYKQALGGFDPDEAVKVMQRGGKDSGELIASSIEKGNSKFLKAFTSAQKELSRQEAIISANYAIIDAELSGRITDAYLNSPGYLNYQLNLNTLAQEQAKLDGIIQKTFLKSKEYTDYLVDRERLDVRRSFTENLIPTLGAIGGGALFNYLGGKMFGGGGIGGTPNLTGGGGGTGAGGFMMMGTQAGAGFGTNLSGALKSGGGIAGGVISGLTSGFMEFSENKQLGLSMGENIGRTTTKAISSGVGGWGGASLGAAIGTAIFPGVGTLVGGFLGGWLGGKGGSALGDAVNNGIWGDKQERIKRTQEAQLSAQNELQKQMSLNRQVDISYYAKMLKLNDQQIAQLDAYNKTQAIQPDWYKQGPAWLNNLKPGQPGSQTYLGSGLAAMPGTFEGDENSPFGRKILKYFDTASQKFSYEIVDVTQTEYEKFIGRKLSKKEIEEAKESAKGPTGKMKVTEGSQLDKAFSASFGKSDAQIFADWMTERQTKIDKEKRDEERRLFNAQDKQLSSTDLAKKQKLLEENKVAVQKMLASSSDPTSPNFDPGTQITDPQKRRLYYEQQSHIPDSYKKLMKTPLLPQQPKITYGSDKTTGEVNAIGMDPSKSTLDPKNQQAAVEVGTSATMRQYNEPGVLQVRDHNIKDLGIDVVLNTIQSQAHLRGISLLGSITGVSTTIKEMSDGIIGAINRLLVYSKTTALSAEAQSTFNQAASGGIKAIGSFLNFPQFAKGTDNAPGGMALVGEKGPELVNLKKGSQVIPNNKLDSYLSMYPGFADGTGHESKDGEEGLFEKLFHHAHEWEFLLGVLNKPKTAATQLWEYAFPKIGGTAGQHQSEFTHGAFGGVAWTKTLEYFSNILKSLTSTKWWGTVGQMYSTYRTSLPSLFGDTAKGLAYVGKGILTKKMLGHALGTFAKDNAVVSTIGSFFNLFTSLTDAGEFAPFMGKEGFSGGRWVANAGQLFGGSMYDFIDDLTFGMTPLTNFGESSGLIIPGLNANETARLRSAYNAAHGKYLNPSNDDLLKWVEQNQDWLSKDMYGSAGSTGSWNLSGDTKVKGKSYFGIDKLAYKYPADAGATKFSFNKYKDYYNKNLSTLPKQMIHSAEGGLVGSITKSTAKALGVKRSDAEGLIGSVLSGRPVDAFSYGISMASDVGNTVLQGTKNAVSSIGSAVSSGFSSLTSFLGFANGTNAAPGGMAVVGERGTELMLHNGMSSLIGTAGPELRYVPKGAQIVPNEKLSQFADGTIGATAALMASNTQQMMQMGKIIADAIVSKQEASPAQNINLLVDGRQLANVQYRRQQNRMGMRPNDLV